MLHAPNFTQHPSNATFIAVIADDFTGAAEIGGIAIRHGFKTVIESSFIPCETEVLIINANTREENPTTARKIIRKLTSQLLELKPTFIYKKVDSVLRGNVADELLEQIEESNKKRALVIPANPSLKRTIENGIYYCDGLPLNRSHFTISTNEHTSSNVIDLMGYETQVISKCDEIPPKGLIIGNTVDETDLDFWAKQLDELTILAGGADFFKSVLKAKMPQRANEQPNIPLGKRQLYVCGSAFESSRRVVTEAFANGQFVAYMPTDLFSEGVGYAKLIAQWAVEIVEGISKYEKVTIAVDVLTNSNELNLSEKISKAFADVIQTSIEDGKVDELFIEGGATASIIIEKLNYQQFYPMQELALGVIRMKVHGNDNIFITVKPGSYAWPPFNSPKQSPN
jgi:uncharacterized protein YgbK (DUF1537 family)